MYMYVCIINTWRSQPVTQPEINQQTRGLGRKLETGKVATTPDHCLLWVIGQAQWKESKEKVRGKIRIHLF